MVNANIYNVLTPEEVVKLAPNMEKETPLESFLKHPFLGFHLSFPRFPHEGPLSNQIGHGQDPNSIYETVPLLCLQVSGAHSLKLTVRTYQEAIPKGK